MRIHNLLWILALTLTDPLLAADFSQFHVLELDEMSMVYRDIHNYRDAYQPSMSSSRDRGCYDSRTGVETSECMQYGAGVQFNIAVLELPWKILREPIGLLWRNNVEMRASNSQVRHVGWEWELAVPLGRVEIGTHHHSQHSLDEASQTGARFDVLDEYYVRAKLYERKK